MLKVQGWLLSKYLPTWHWRDVVCSISFPLFFLLAPWFIYLKWKLEVLLWDFERRGSAAVQWQANGRRFQKAFYWIRSKYQTQVMTNFRNPISEKLSHTRFWKVIILQGITLQPQIWGSVWIRFGRETSTEGPGLEIVETYLIEGNEESMMMMILQEVYKVRFHEFVIVGGLKLQLEWNNKLSTSKNTNCKAKTYSLPASPPWYFHFTSKFILYIRFDWFVVPCTVR